MASELLSGVEEEERAGAADSDGAGGKLGGRGQEDSGLRQLHVSGPHAEPRQRGELKIRDLFL